MMGKDGFDQESMREPAPAGSFCVDEKGNPKQDRPEAPLEKEKKSFRAADFNRNSIFLDAVSILVPIIGMMLYAIFKEQEPVKAKGILTGTLLGFGLILLFLLWLKYQSDTMV